MIVPSGRLLWWVGLAGIPAVAVATLVPGAGPPGWGLAALLALAALVDAATSAGLLDSLLFVTDEVVRASKDREMTIPVRIRHPENYGRLVGVGLPLPREIFSKQEVHVTRLLEGVVQSRFDWPCVCLRRGKYRIERAHVETASTFGFWTLRRSFPLDIELRVYPNLMRERKTAAALFLNRGVTGIHAQRQVGKGRDFEKLREYLPGDSYEDIHWKTTAKRCRPVTKTYQIERTQEVYVAIDCSRLSTRESGISTRAELGEAVAGADPELTGRQPMFEKFLTAALLLGIAAERQGDNFGLLTFGDRVHHFVRARNGRKHYDACRDAVYTAKPELVSPDFDELFSFIRLRLRKRALIVILTSLDDPVLAESFTRSVSLIARQHFVVVQSMNPGGIHPLFDKRPVKTIDDLYETLGGHLQWSALRELEKRLSRDGVRFGLHEEAELTLAMITQYMNIKRRQLI